MPHNSSSAIMWLNLDAFEKAGLSTTDLPKTWKQIRAAAEKIKAANAAPVAVTTSWPTWVMFEQMAAMHDVPFATLSNGFEGLGAELRLTSPLFVKQVEYLLALQKDGMFRYGGRDNAADGAVRLGRGGDQLHVLLAARPRRQGGQVQMGLRAAALP